MTSESDEINFTHYAPNFPEKHKAENCWCEPILLERDPKTGDEVWQHRWIH